MHWSNRVEENGDINLLRHFNIQRDQVIEFKRPEITIVKTEDSCYTTATLDNRLPERTRNIKC